MRSEIDPDHYRSHGSGVESIEICENLDYRLGNAVKYLWRTGKKGDPVTDLKKAAWYLRRAMEYPIRHNSHLVQSHFPLSHVIASEPDGSVLRDVLELVVSKMLIGDEPRLADALLRVELEITTINNRSKK